MRHGKQCSCGSTDFSWYQTVDVLMTIDNEDSGSSGFHINAYPDYDSLLLIPPNAEVKCAHCECVFKSWDEIPDAAPVAAEEE